MTGLIDDLAQAFGITTVEASERLDQSLRGDPRSLQAIGVVPPRIPLWVRVLRPFRPGWYQLRLQRQIVAQTEAVR